jgi:hypothetical protein
MLPIEKSVRETAEVRADSISEDVLASAEPVLLKGLVSDWPLVQAASQSCAAADSYLRQFYDNATVGVFFAPPGEGGRIFYNEELSGFNYQPVMLKLDEVLDRLQQHLQDENPPSIYIGSTTVDTCLPGFRGENHIGLGDIEPLVSIWLGNRTRVAAHFDLPDNIACCAVGRRRFILFPPSELKNLYIGPLDFTPAGQSISLVDFQNPDYKKFPRFREALRHAQLVELEPGDALYIPSMWWHHVEALDGFNVLINYWWRETPAFMGDPRLALNHALLSLRDLPAEQREAWQNIFRHYVFEFDEKSVSHIPETRRGILSAIDETTARKIRADLLNRLNR